MGRDRQRRRFSTTHGTASDAGKTEFPSIAGPSNFPLYFLPGPLGWQIEEDVVSWLTVHWHNGGTGGYKSYVGLVESHDVGVVLLSNSGDSVGDGALDRMGFEILRLASKVGLSPTRDVAPEPTAGD